MDSMTSYQDLVGDAVKRLEAGIEEWLRRMAPFAGRVDCGKCGGDGVIIKRSYSMPPAQMVLECRIRRCDCVDILRELQRLTDELENKQ